MKKVLITLFTVLFVFPLGIHSASAQDKDCPDFSSWQEAQTYFESIGGSPTNNANGLDRNIDGMACEESFTDDPADWTWEKAHPGTTEGGQQGGTKADNKVQLKVVNKVEPKVVNYLKPLQIMEME